MKHAAFISYSHKRDEALAASLETALEAFAKPLFRRRALSIFRDASGLSAAPHLWASIEVNLAASEYFILMASPDSAKSPWCQKEVEYWIQNKSMDRFLIALTHGELEWNEEAGDFDWHQTDAVPEVLAGAFAGEPLYVDCRQPIPRERQHLGTPEFEELVVQLAATLHGKKVEDMVGEAARQHRRNLRVRNSAIVVLSALTLLASAMSVYANKQRGIAVERQAEAEAATTQAQSLLQLTLQGRGQRYDEDQPIDRIILQLEEEQERPLQELVEIRALRQEVNATNYDYMVWVDVPSFRTDEIREVRYEWPEEGGFRYARESFVSRESSTGYAFAWRGTNAVKDSIRIEIIPVDSSASAIVRMFPIRDHLQIVYEESIEVKRE